MNIVIAFNTNRSLGQGEHIDLNVAELANRLHRLTHGRAYRAIRVRVDYRDLCRHLLPPFHSDDLRTEVSLWIQLGLSLPCRFRGRMPRRTAEELT